MPKKTFSIISLGCFRNTYDSEIVAEKFLNKGYIFKEKIKGSHCLVVNTCGFIEKAKQESLEVIKEAVNLKKQKKIKEIVIFGCLVERYKDDLKKSFPEVNQWRGVEKISPEFIKRKKLSLPHTDFLKISEGCLNNCSYCAIPLIKGALKSKPQKEILKEVKFLDKKGIKELNIIGQDITSWGKDLNQKEGLTNLVKNILKQTNNIRWLRLIYTHPKHLSDSLIDLIAGSQRICKYIDLPIQHINDRILSLMNRQITKKKIISLIKRIKTQIPNCFLRTSVIVGFPTETESEFSELLGFLKEIRFQRLGAFIYSREEGTAAYNLKGQAHYRTKLRRFKEVMSVQQKEVLPFINNGLIGQSLDVLVEEKEKDVFIGRTQYDAPEVDGVVFLKKKGLKIGDFYKTKIIGAYEYDLVGI